jgi:5,6-dimethylbenzimidazole synthase
VEAGRFSDETREAVYEAIFGRRDVRAFRPDPVPEETLDRLLVAAHHAPSVGFMQPWDFVVVRDYEMRERIERSFQRARRAEAERYEEPLRSK